MGFFSRFMNKGKKDIAQEHHYPNTDINRPPYEVSSEYTPEGYLQVEVRENYPKDDQFYDITRLIIQGSPVIMTSDRIPVLNCLVSHYGSSDCILIGSDGREYGRRSDYRHVLAEFDVNLLLKDKTYAYSVLVGLLNKSRVDRYLNDGMKDNPKHPCGIYVGGINPSTRVKYFDPNVGRESHYSPKMQDKRARAKEAAIERMKDEYQRNQMRIAELQERNKQLEDGINDER